MRKSSWRTVCGGVALALLVSAGTARADDPAGAPAAGKWHPWFELGGYVSNERSRGEAALWAPLWQSGTALVFTDMRGKLFDEGAEEGNVALGLRVMLRSGWNLGLWGGWDHRRTEQGSSFNQVAFGVEALSDRFDFRANGYLPTRDRAHLSTSVASVSSTATTTTSSTSAAALLQGNALSVVTSRTTTVAGTTTTEFTTTRLFEHALHGFDAEFGFRVPLERLFARPVERTGRARRHEFRLYGGGFWFDNDDVEEIAGPRARVEWRVNDLIAALPGSRLTIEGEFQYDDVRRDQWEGGLRLRIPFGGGGRAARRAATVALTPQERRMMDGLERDTDVVAQGTSETATTTTSRTVTTETAAPPVQEAAIDDATNVALNQVAFATDPASLAAAVATGANTLITVQDAGGNIDVSGSNGQALQASQTIQGGGSTIQIRGATSGAVVPFTAPGARPTLLSNDTNANTGVVTVASNSHVAGLTIQGPGGVLAGNFGIRGVDGLTNVVIEQNTISNTGDDGVRFGDNNSNVRVSGNTISNAGGGGLGAGVRFENTNSNVTVSGNTISDLDLAVHIVNMNSNVTLSGNTISNASESARFGGFLPLHSSAITTVT